MKKILWTVALAAVLPLASCVDGTESPSVTQVRNSKSEWYEAQATLAKAEAEAAIIQANALKAQVEAEAAYKESMAAYQEALAEAQKAQAELTRAQAELTQAQAAVEAARAAALQAQTEADKAKAEAELAALQLQNEAAQIANEAAQIRNEQAQVALEKAQLELQAAQEKLANELEIARLQAEKQLLELEQQIAAIQNQISDEDNAKLAALAQQVQNRYYMYLSALQSLNQDRLQLITLNQQLALNEAKIVSAQELCQTTIDNCTKNIADAEAELEILNNSELLQYTPAELQKKIDELQNQYSTERSAFAEGQQWADVLACNDPIQEAIDALYEQIDLLSQTKTIAQLNGCYNLIDGNNSNQTPNISLHKYYYNGNNPLALSSTCFENPNGANLFYIQYYETLRLSETAIYNVTTAINANIASAETALQNAQEVEKNIDTWLANPTAALEAAKKDAADALAYANKVQHDADSVMNIPWEKYKAIKDSLNNAWTDYDTAFDWGQENASDIYQAAWDKYQAELAAAQSTYDSENIAAQAYYNNVDQPKIDAAWAAYNQKNNIYNKIVYAINNPDQAKAQAKDEVARCQANLNNEQQDLEEFQAFSVADYLKAATAFEAAIEKQDAAVEAWNEAAQAINDIETQINTLENLKWNNLNLAQITQRIEVLNQQIENYNNQIENAKSTLASETLTNEEAIEIKKAEIAQLEEIIAAGEENLATLKAQYDDALAAYEAAATAAQE